MIWKVFVRVDEGLTLQGFPRGNNERCSEMMRVYLKQVINVTIIHLNCKPVCFVLYIIDLY